MNKKSVISIHGGLGNQLFQLGLAEKLSKDSLVSVSAWKNQVRTDEIGKLWISHFKLFKKFGNPISRVDKIIMSYSRLVFRIALLESTLKKFSVVFLIIRNIMTVVPQLFRVRIVASAENGDFRIPSLLSRNYFVAYFQTEDAAIQLKDKLSKELQSITSANITARAKVNEILVLHIRRTDYKDNPKIGLLPKDYFSKALEAASNQFSWNEIWLFSDDPTEAITLIPEKFREKLHIVSSNSDNPVEVMSQMIWGSCYILSNSTFGWWSAQMSVNPSRFVIAPKKWFAQMDEPVGLMPKDWIRVQ